MPTKQELRSEETKRNVLEAAGRLFSERGYETVTMREIAKAAGCSHTTIYIYFKDKEALLHHLSMAPLQQLRLGVSGIQSELSVSPEERLKRISQTMIQFCVVNRNMYEIFFTVKSARVDEDHPDSVLNQMRNGLFAQLQQAVQACLPPGIHADQLLAYSRIYFYMLQGIVATYTNSEETDEALMARLSETFDEAIEVLLIGFTRKLSQGGN